MDPSGGRYPAIMSLPYEVQRKLSGILDGAAVHNWRSLVEQLPGYTQNDAVVFATEEQKGRSPTMAILEELDSRGWSVVDLAQVAHTAQLGIVVDTIKEHCRAYNHRLWLDPSPTSSLYSARMCSQRPISPPQPTPPTSPTALREALVRYSSSSTPDDTAHTLELSTVCVPYQALHRATAGFSQIPYASGGHKLGEGGSGEVFHCHIPLLDGQEAQDVAVKVLRRNTEKSSMQCLGHTQFLAEIQALSKLSHAHLVPVLGFSSDGPQQCIIYPYYPRGSLDHHLPHSDTLTPVRRLKVACQVASALKYLHTGCKEVFVHRDIKSANILMSEDWSGALGDYGVLRIQPSAGTMMTTTVAGTPEYMDPDYIKGGMVSEKTDVYSFGVVLFELLLGATAHGPISNHNDGIEGTDIVSFVEDFEGSVSSVLIGEWPDDVSQAMWCLADHCIEGKRKRPTSTEVHKTLQTLMELIT